MLKTEGNLDSVSLAPVKWDIEPSMEGSKVSTLLSLWLTYLIHQKSIGARTLGPHGSTRPPPLNSMPSSNFPGPTQALTDIMAAAETPMESALSICLNDLLWVVERKSMDSMDPADVAAARVSKA